MSNMQNKSQLTNFELRWCFWGDVFLCTASKHNGLFFIVISGVFVPYYFMPILKNKVCLAVDKKKEENQTKTKKNRLKLRQIQAIFSQSVILKWVLSSEYRAI